MSSIKEFPSRLSSETQEVGFEEVRPMRRNRLHDEEWNRIKILLLGIFGHVDVFDKNIYQS